MDDLIYIPGIRLAIESGAERITAFIVREEKRIPLELKVEGLSQEDRDIILTGCLINYYTKSPEVSMGRGVIRKL